MSVKLISCTQGADFVQLGSGNGLMNAEELIAYTARVSNPANQMNTETAPRLLAYLIRHKHWSPFEMAHMTVEIKTSRAIAAQILRHRSFSFQEFSQRYAAVTDFVTYEARRQDVKNKQNSIDDLSAEDKEWFRQALHKNQLRAQGIYEIALEKGIAKECARFLLPLNTETTLYMCGSVRSWIHYLELRTSPSTQLEHREIALAIKREFETQFPNIAAALALIGEGK